MPRSTCGRRWWVGRGVVVEGWSGSGRVECVPGGEAELSRWLASRVEGWSGVGGSPECGRRRRRWRWLASVEGRSREITGGKERGEGGERIWGCLEGREAAERTARDCRRRGRKTLGEEAATKMRSGACAQGTARRGRKRRRGLCCWYGSRVTRRRESGRWSLWVVWPEMGEKKFGGDLRQNQA